ncbi:MAG TPA: multicopper oxidase family protein, partial [Paracoccaceae bacterium]
PDAPPPVLRLRQGQPARITVENRLDEVTTVHWHGLRVPNAQDGVPYLTQFPIGAGESYTYEFTPQDAGTYWYHPHCNTLEQISRGMAGMLIVEEAEAPDFDADLALQLRDFRLGGDGQFLEFWKARAAAREGTLGTVATANWQVAPRLAAPAGGLLRLRLAVTDVTRLFRLRLRGPGADQARIVALDGHPLAQPEALEAALHLGPGQRADLVIAMPAEAGARLTLIRETAAGAEDAVLAELVAEGPDLGRRIGSLVPLPPNPVAGPELARAEKLDFVLGWTPEGAPSNGSVCGDIPYRFWSINRRVWPGDLPPDPADPLAPLAELKRGRSYVFRLVNESPNRHPIHLHGMTFRLLNSNKRALRGNLTDTALVEANETVDIAFVADNPGDWVFHCHVIEHQKTGLAGFVRVLG